MIQVIDIVLLAINALLTSLRKPRVIAWLTGLVNPFFTIDQTLHNTHEAYAEDYLSWGSELWLMEKMLNVKFNPAPGFSPRIVIDDGNRIARIYLHYFTDHDPLFMNPTVYGHTLQAYSENYYDFTVEIPTSLGLAVDDPRIIQMLNRYKLAGKQYKIVLI